MDLAPILDDAIPLGIRHGIRFVVGRLAQRSLAESGQTLEQRYDDAIRRYDEYLAKAAEAKAKAQAPRRMAKPGCTAAEETIVVLGYLGGLAKGRNGYPVLALAKDHLERAAQGAEGMGDQETAGKLRDFAPRLAAVHDAEAAGAAFAELAAIEEATWELGRRCGGAGVSRAVVQDLRAGRIRPGQAAAKVRGG